MGHEKITNQSGEQFCCFVSLPATINKEVKGKMF